MTTDKDVHARPSVAAVLATIGRHIRIAVADAGVGDRTPSQHHAAGQRDAYAHCAQLVGTLTESPLRGRLYALARDLADAGHEDAARRIHEALHDGPAQPTE